jgi:hypothetical protein
MELADESHVSARVFANTPGTSGNPAKTNV